MLSSCVRFVWKDVSAFLGLFPSLSPVLSSTSCHPACLGRCVRPFGVSGHVSHLVSHLVSYVVSPCLQPFLSGMLCPPSWVCPPGLEFCPLSWVCHPSSTLVWDIPVCFRCCLSIGPSSCLPAGLGCYLLWLVSGLISCWSVMPVCIVARLALQ